MATKPKSVITKQEVLNRVLSLVANGKYDGELDYIIQVVQSRRVTLREQQAMRNLLTLSKVETRVRLVDRITPRYLGGLAGEVVPRPEGFVKSKPNTIYVKLDHGRVRKYGPVVGVPAALLEAE